MTEDEWRARIAEVEQYFTDRVYDANWQTRWYYPAALEAMAFVSECVEADFYQVERPDPPNAWTARAIEYFDDKWGRT